MSNHVNPPTCSPISEGFMATQDQWNEVENRLVQPWTAPEELPYVLRPERACIFELLGRVKALEGLNCASAILKLSGRVDALEAAHNLRQQDEDVEMVTGDPQPIATNEEILRVYWTGGNSSDARLRCVYDLGRQHGATQAICPHIRSSDEGTSYCALAEQSANSKPTSNFAQIRSSADTGLLPMIVSETGSDDEPETERIICSAISGGADYVNGMPRELSLERIRDGDSISARYVQTPSEVAGAPAEMAGAGGLMEMLADVWSECKPLHPAARRAAIHHIADWLELQQEVPISANYFAAMLREEANQ